jgi:hypothetical protein
VEEDVGVGVGEAGQDEFVTEVDVVVWQGGGDVGGAAGVKVADGTGFGVDLDGDALEELFVDGFVDDRGVDGDCVRVRGQRRRFHSKSDLFSACRRPRVSCPLGF